ncbi:MAG: type II toxin-antitoxin system VapC family toxin, partial [Pseudaminobacter sp.]|nr:type II toxin-antitoxin system VapC family toxin [Pseudaminobacter sp.]
MIVDANVATYWFVDTPLSNAARAILSRADLIAPNLVRLEIANALLKFLRAGEISGIQLAKAMAQTERTISEFIGDHTLLPRAIELAAANNHKIYDCLYLALALERREPLAT